jgi:hypothetical protein
MCAESWQSVPSRCLCGYDFAERDPQFAIKVSRTELGRANRMAIGGLLMMVTLPLGVFLWPHSALLVLLLAPVQLCVGTLLSVVGIARGSRPRKALRAARALRKLPAARVVT